MPLEDPWTCTSNYLPWFYKVSHPYVILLDEGKPSRGLVHLLSIPVQPHPRQLLVDLHIRWILHLIDNANCILLIFFSKLSLKK